MPKLPPSLENGIFSKMMFSKRGFGEKRLALFTFIDPASMIDVAYDKNFLAVISLVENAPVAYAQFVKLSVLADKRNGNRLIKVV